MANIGKITQIIGPVVDVSFEGEGASLPNILDALEIDRPGTTPIVMEVQQHIGEDTVRAIAMDSTDGLVRGMSAKNTGKPIMMPIGKAVLGRILFNGDSRVPTIGASGAIAGVMGAYVVKFPHSRITTLVPVFVFLTTMEIPAYFILIYWFVIQFFSGVGQVGHSHLSQGGVAWFAHVGGFLAGIALILTMRTQDRFSHRPDMRW